MFSIRRVSKKAVPYLIGVGTVMIIYMLYNDGLFRPVYSEENETPWNNTICIVDDETPYYDETGSLDYSELFEPGKEYGKDGEEIVPDIPDIPVPIIPGFDGGAIPSIPGTGFLPAIPGIIRPGIIGPGFVPHIGYGTKKTDCINRHSNNRHSNVGEPDSVYLILIGIIGFMLSNFYRRSKHD